MTKYIAEDITGQKFNFLKAIKFVDSYRGMTRWLFECECGSLKTINKGAVKSGNTKSCGCKKHPFKNWSGHTFGNFTVLEVDQERTRPKKRKWKCQCVCGNVKSLDSSVIKSQTTTHCGCLRNSRKPKIVGKVIGNRKILEYSHCLKDMTYWKYECSCGNIGITTVQSLRRSPCCKKCYSVRTLGFGAPTNNGSKYKYLYLCVHPQRMDEYKIGIADNPRYREQKCHGGLLLLDYVQAKTPDVIAAEAQILIETFSDKIIPIDQPHGKTEWRKGENVVKVWHQHGSLLAS